MAETLLKLPLPRITHPPSPPRCAAIKSGCMVAKERWMHLMAQYAQAGTIAPAHIFLHFSRKT